MTKDKSEKRKTLIGVSALVIAALLWGGEFVVAKDVLSTIEPNWTNALRFLATSVFSLIIWRKQFKRATVKDWQRGAISGVLFGFGYAFQTMGLEIINAGVNAFVSTAYVVIIPFIVWVIEKKRPGSKVFICAAIAMSGVAIMSISEISSSGFAIGLGEGFTLIGAACYAGAIVSVDYFTTKTDVTLLTGMQFIFAAAVALIMALLTEDPPSDISTVIVLQFVYLIILGTFFTQLLFNFGMKYVSAERGGMIFLLESVSASFFGWLFLGELLNGQQVAGSAFIIAAIILSNFEVSKKSEQLENSEP